jgi:DNA-binding NtrC family response regulator
MNTVLLVEDDVLIRILLADELRAHGFNVVEAQTADEALDLLKRQVPVRVVVADVQLPGSMNGLALAQLVRESHPKVKVVIASGNVSSAPGNDIANAFFAKPYAPDEIVNCVEGLLATR